MLLNNLKIKLTPFLIYHIAEPKNKSDQKNYNHQEIDSSGVSDQHGGMVKTTKMQTFKKKLHKPAEQPKKYTNRLAATSYKKKSKVMPSLPQADKIRKVAK